MCRLLGWASREPRTLTDLLGPEDLREFTDLSCKHGDGWGMAWAGEGGVEVTKRPDAARESDVFAQMGRRHSSDLGMAHLRWATLGLPVRLENTHPFTDGTFAFAHNGSIRPPAALDPLISPDVAALAQGETDSERYFLALLSLLQSEPDPGRALSRLVAHLAATCDYTSLNCLLMGPERLYAVCRFDPDADHGEEADYFHLRYRLGPDAVVVASSGWGNGWVDLANGEMLVVDRRTMHASVHSVLEDRAAS